MTLKALAAAALVVTSVPFAMQEADGQTAKAPAEKRYCEINVPTGSRLGAIRRCRTKAERAALEAETREALTRNQTQKHYTDQMRDMRALCPGSGSRFC